MKNRKRLLTLALLCIAVVFSVLGLTACGTAVEFKINFMVDGEVVSTINTGGNETIALPDDPVKEGFTFDGWYWDNDTWQRPFTASSLLNEPLSKDMNVYAKWQGDGISFKTLIADDKDNVYGKVSNTQQTFSFLNEVSVTGKATFVVSNDIYGVNQIPTKTVPLNVGDNTYYVLESIGSNIRLFTVTIRRKPMYTVSFDTYGGSSVLSQQIEEDAFATEPDAATRQGYTFNGWNYDFTKAVTENLSITASWNIIDYDIVYVLNEGENSAENPLHYTVEQTITLSAPSKTGYAFTGWSDDGKILLGSTGTKIFIANWQPIVYTLTYVCGEGENNSLNVTNYTIESETIVLSDPYDINADFTEWQCNGKKITEIPKGSYGDLTLTAVWKKYDVKLKLNTDGKTYSVIGINTDKTDIVIKPIYKTYSVTAIAENAFKNCSSLTRITIPDSVTSIDNSAFFGCSSLTSVTIPDSVTSIGEDAFYYCTSLTSVTIPNSVTSISDRAFRGCSSLTRITIPDSVTSIGSNAFNGCPIEYASAPAFAFGYIGKNNLKTAIITSGDSIVEKAFYGCDSLTSITIPDSVTSISNSAFYNCTSLKSITIPDSVTGISNSAFENCPIEYASAPAFAFGYIGKNNLKTAIITSGDSIDNSAFKEITSLTIVTIGNGVKSIGYRTFFGCKSLISVTIPDSVTSIGDEAFQYCYSLTSITISDSVTSIGDEAFSGCYKLVEVINKSNLNITKHSSDNGAVGYYALNVKTDGQSDIVNKNDYLFYTYGGINYLLGYVGNDTNLNLPENFNGENYEVYNCAFWPCTSLTSVTIPDSVTSIGNSAFWYCTSLTSVTIGNGVTSIGYIAFWACTSLTSITIGNSVTSIGNSAFSHCSSLTNVTIPDSVTSIGEGVFSDCSSLTSITIPDSVTSIGGRAFSGCSSLTSITIPDSVTSIGGSAFEDCNQLKTINYTGSEAQWESISKGYAWKPSARYNINYNYVIPTNENA